MSKFIFTCLAISTTLLLYQNIQLEKEVETIKTFMDIEGNSARGLEKLYELREKDRQEERYDKCLERMADIIEPHPLIDSTQLIIDTCDILVEDDE